MTLILPGRTIPGTEDRPPQLPRARADLVHRADLVSTCVHVASLRYGMRTVVTCRLLFGLVRLQAYLLRPQGIRR